MMASLPCPTVAELSAFALGNLSGTSFARIAGHLDSCRACEASLQAFDGLADPLVAGLQHAPVVSHPDCAMPQDLVSAARQAASAGGTALDIALYSGRRYARQLAAGDCRLGKFELQAELGTGSFGYVFRARDTELDRTVALKIQRAGSLADAEEASRFLREARSVAQLKHPGIVSLYEIGQTEDGVCFLVTEFIEGETLEQVLRSGPPEPRLGGGAAAPGGRGLAVRSLRRASSIATSSLPTS